MSSIILYKKPGNLSSSIFNSSSKLSDLLNLTQEIGFKFGSMDLFIDISNNIGIIEYCNQFGFYGKKPNFIRKFHEDFISNVLNEKGFFS